jgi:hypothetical protein
VEQNRRTPADEYKVASLLRLAKVAEKVDETRFLCLMLPGIADHIGASSHRVHE